MSKLFSESAASSYVDTDDLPHVYTYNGPNGKIDTDTVTDGHYTWKKTFTYSGSNLVGESAWVKQ